MAAVRSFSRERRLKKRSEFLDCYALGRKFHTAHFILYVRPAQGACRFGLTVSKKVGNAVIRNRIKRLLRECFRSYSGCLENCRIVAVARRRAEGLSLSDTAAEIYPILRRLSE